jgi:dolichol-phosphate mannosyltransferase
MYRGKSIIVVAPAYNEQTKIQSVVARIEAMAAPCVDEIVVVDDGSTDASAEQAEEAGATVIRLGRCYGVGAALRRGFEYGKAHRYDICVCIAGNNKDDPEEIPRLLEPIVSGDADLVQGSRYLPGGVSGNTPMYRRLATRIHPWLFSLFVGKRMTESTNGFRAFRLSLLRDPGIKLDQRWLDGYELEPYLLFQVIRRGYKHREVPCTKIYPTRELGQTKVPPVTGWWALLRPIFLLGFGIKD